MSENERPLPSPQPPCEKPVDDGKRTIVDGNVTDIGEDGVADDAQAQDFVRSVVEKDLLNWRTLRDSGAITKEHCSFMEKVALSKLTEYDASLTAIKNKYGLFQKEMIGEVGALCRQHVLEISFQAKSDGISSQWLKFESDANLATEGEIKNLAAASLKNNGEKGGENDDILMGYDEIKKTNYPIEVGAFEIRLRTSDPAALDSLAFAHYLAWVQQKPESRGARLKQCLERGNGKTLAGLWGVEATGAIKGSKDGETPSMKKLREGVAAKMGVDADAAIALARKTMAEINAVTFRREGMHEALVQAILKAHESANAAPQATGSNDPYAQVGESLLAANAAKKAKKYRENVEAMVAELLKADTSELQAKALAEHGFKKLDKKAISSILSQANKFVDENARERSKSSRESFLRQFKQSPDTVRAENLKAFGRNQKRFDKILADAQIAPDAYLMEIDDARLAKAVAAARIANDFSIGDAFESIRVQNQARASSLNCSGLQICIPVTTQAVSMAASEDPKAQAEAQTLLAAANVRVATEVAKGKAADAVARRTAEKLAADGNLSPEDVSKAFLEESDKLLADPAYGADRLAEFEKKAESGDATPAEKELLTALRGLSQARAQSETAQLATAQAAVDAARKTGTPEPEWARTAIAGTAKGGEADPLAEKKIDALGLSGSRAQEIRDLGEWRVSPAGMLVADEGAFTLRLDEKAGTVLARQKGGVAEIPFRTDVSHEEMKRELAALHDLKLDKYGQLQNIIRVRNESRPDKPPIVLEDGLTDAATGNTELAELADLSEFMHFGSVSPSGEALQTRIERMSKTPWSTIEGRLNRMPQEKRFYDLGAVVPEALKQYLKGSDVQEKIARTTDKDKADAQKTIENWPPV